MRRRTTANPATIPEHLAEFVPAQWGWTGPESDGAGWSEGYQQAQRRYLEQRNAWLEQHPEFDWLADILERHPDAPWTPA